MWLVSLGRSLWLFIHVLSIAERQHQEFGVSFWGCPAGGDTKPNRQEPGAAAD